MFDKLKEQPADSLLALIKTFQADPRLYKVDLGVGVYRDEQGRTPVMRAVKLAERHLLETQDSKRYLGPEGDLTFVNLLKPIIRMLGSGWERPVGRTMRRSLDPLGWLSETTVLSIWRCRRSTSLAC
jgi:hypothetical protein